MKTLLTIENLRAVATVFFLMVVTLCILGWRWAVTLPEAKMEGARFVLTLSALASIAGLTAIWRIKSRESR